MTSAPAHRPRIILLSVLGTLVVLAAVGVGVMVSGVYDVAATDEHLGVTRWALRTTTVRSIKAHADEGDPVELPDDEEALRRGYRMFDQMCVQCHGAPGVEAQWIGKGMRPTPPDLIDAADFYTPAQLEWIITHGIKFTGMPAMAPTHSAEEIREVTAFVLALRDMSPQDYEMYGSGGTPQKTAARPSDAHQH